VQIAMVQQVEDLLSDIVKQLNNNEAAAAKPVQMDKAFDTGRWHGIWVSPELKLLQANILSTPSEMQICWSSLQCFLLLC
jgi:hypothetical protein